MRHTIRRVEFKGCRNSWSLLLEFFSAPADGCLYAVNMWEGGVPSTCLFLVRGWKRAEGGCLNLKAARGRIAKARARHERNVVLRCAQSSL